jgi:hypothetical protein
MRAEANMVLPIAPWAGAIDRQRYFDIIARIAAAFL